MQIIDGKLSDDQLETVRLWGDKAIDELDDPEKTESIILLLLIEQFLWEKK